MNISFLQYFISISLYVVFLLFFIEIIRKYYKLSLIFWILTILTFPLWNNQLEGWFRWTKTLSVLIPTAFLVGFGRIANIENTKNKILSAFKKDWVLWVLYAVLFLNIIEAVVKDAVTENYFNAITGFILAITIPLVKIKSKGKIKPKWIFTKEKPSDLLIYTSFGWSLLYTIWNMAFVFGENPGYFASSFSILLAAELYPIIKNRPELYVISRVYTIAFHIFIRANYDIFTPIMDSSSWANPKILFYWGIINFIIALPFFIYCIFKLRKQ